MLCSNSKHEKSSRATNDNKEFYILVFFILTQTLKAFNDKGLVSILY